MTPWCGRGPGERVRRRTQRRPPRVRWKTVAMTGDVAPEISLATDLRAALVAADFTYDAVAELLGRPGAPGAESQRDHSGRTANCGRLRTEHADPAVPAPDADRARGGRAGPAGTGRPALQRRPARAERRRGRGPDGLSALLQRRRRPVGRLRPDARPRRRADAGRHRPRARDLQCVDQPGAADGPRRSRSRAGPRDGLRRTSPAPGDPCGRRSSPPTSTGARSG